MSSAIDVSRLKVPELRAELGRRGLNTFGTKQTLMDRLNEALKLSGEQPIEKPQTPTTPDLDAEHSSETNNQDVTSSAVDLNLSSGDASQPTIGSPPKGSENGFPAADDSDSKSDHQHSLDGEPLKRKRSPSPRRRSRSRDRDSRRSPRKRSRSPSSRSKICEEPSNWENSTSVFLDTYNCDLNLIIDASGYAARPQTEGGFSLMWAGVRANYGVISGKSFFEVRVLKHIPVESFDSLIGGATHVLRVGWSTENSEFALGEESESYGYGGTGKKSCNNKFSDYGCEFGEGDVVGAFIEWTSSEAVLRFSVNGVDQGECFRVQKSLLGDDCALFPHVYVKNVEFAVNFGQEDLSAWFTPDIPGDDPSSWCLVNNLDLSARVHGRLPPSSKSECEVIMMIGLPGSGKTYYAENHRAEHKEQQYNVLGTNLILDKMKVMGLARQRNYHGRWDVLIDKATKCLNSLINVASMRRRNYILDQTNVYPSAQRRKMRPFEGFKRKAIVIVPTDEEFRRRIAQREKEEGKEVPESAVLEMKANFVIPKPVNEDSSSVFDEVIFTELDAEESKALVERYNDEGHSSRSPPEKRQRWDGGNRDRDNSRDSRFRGRDNRDRGRDFNRGRRDDFRRSPNRRDDRGRRDFRNDFNATRDRSRDEDRFDRNRDRDSYGRQQRGRFAPPSGRFGGPPNRGGFPGGMSGPGGFGNFDGPRGGMMRGGPGRGYGGPMFDASRGGRGGFRGPSGAFGGPGDQMYNAHFDGSAVGTELQNSSYGLPSEEDSMGGAGQMPYEGGFRSGFDASGPRGAPPGRGVGPNRGGGQGGRGSGLPGRDGGMGRGSPADRAGGRGRTGSSGRGGLQADRDVSGGYDDPQQSHFNVYAGQETYQNMNEDAYAAGQGDDYRGRGRDRYAAGPYGPSSGAKPTNTGYPNYQRNNPPAYPQGPAGFTNTGPVGYSGGPTGYQNTGGGSAYPSSGFQNDPSMYSNAGPNPYGNTIPGSDMSGNRMGRSGHQNVNAATGGPRMYGSSDPDKTSAVPNERGGDGSLYASGAARFTDARPPGSSQPSAPRQSRFDSKSPTGPSSQQQQQQQPYSNYNVNPSYPGGFGGGFASANAQKPAQSQPPNVPTTASTPASVPAPGGPRSGRSRFDVGPGTAQPSSTPPTSQTAPQTVQNNQPPQTQASARQQTAGVTQQSSAPTQQPLTAQAYGYSYGAQSQKPDITSQAQHPATTQASYGAYGYGYGYGAYSAQPVQPTTVSRPPAPSVSSTQSLYASAVADKPSVTQPTVSAVSTSVTPASSTDHSAVAAAAYASYYYGTPTGASTTTQGAVKYDAGMAAAQQFNAWQQQQQPSTISSQVPGVAATPVATMSATIPTATAYPTYYPGYSAYPTGYGAVPVPGAPAGTVPGVPAASAQTMPQYYAGYR